MHSVAPRLARDDLDLVDAKHARQNDVLGGERNNYISNVQVARASDEKTTNNAITYDDDMYAIKF